MRGSILGTAVKRVEDPRFITGGGTHLADIDVPGMVHCVPVRSPVPHGTIGDIDCGAAARAPGVIAVYTAGDVDLAPLSPGSSQVPRACGRPPLATERVRFAGEVVAVVVADRPERAVDAAELVWADIDPLPAVATVESAMAPGAPQLFEALDGNVVHRFTDEADPDLFADADVVVVGRFRNQRLAAVPMETNGALAVPHDDGRLEVWLGSQNVFGHRRALVRSLGIDEAQLRVVVPDMGGGFGAKVFAYPEQVIVAAVARMLRRPVRWLETRRQNLTGMYHGRDQRHDVELGVRRDGRIVALRATVIQNVGAYPTFGTYLPTLTRRMATGVYTIERAEVDTLCVATNTTPIHAYRGAGRPEAAAMIERAVDMAAAELGIDPAEMRRRNLIAPHAFPYETATGMVYDSGDYAAALDQALEIAGYDELRSDQEARRQRGDRRQVGIGLSTYVEVTAPFGGSEWSSVEVHATGRVTVTVGTSSHGQGHATAFAQLVADRLRIPMADVDVVQGDTDVVRRGDGTVGSRSLQLGGSAVARAGEEVVDKARRIVAAHLEAAVEDIVVFDTGGLGVAGHPAGAIEWNEVAKLASDPEHVAPGESPGLAAEHDFTQAASTFPFGAHVCVVEVDVETGATKVLRHIAVDDCGRVLNPLLVRGQVHGGIAQGIGQALLEHVRYDDDANPLSGTLVSYLIPTAGMLPSFELGELETPTPLNPLGAKGIGESGTIGATPAVQNAVVDAVSHLGVRHVDMPATAGAVWEAVAQARTRE